MGSENSEKLVTSLNGGGKVIDYWWPEMFCLVENSFDDLG